jgi:hypothetical protein
LDVSRIPIGRGELGYITKERDPVDISWPGAMADDHDVGVRVYVDKLTMVAVGEVGVAGPVNPP